MAWLALLLGVVEGLTEFLPVSSTGHLILAERLVGFGDRRAVVFAIFIQLGAVLAVVWEYRGKLIATAAELPRRASARTFVGKLALAFLPSAALGLAAHDFLVDNLFRAPVVAAALVAGALAILLIEALPLAARTRDIESVSWLQALAVGGAQCVALWPGFSRSAATILGGLAAGLDRRAAAEFSFFLAIPTLAAAAGYNLLKSYASLTPADLGWLALASGVSFFVAWGSIRWLLAYVSTHSFRIFAWYRLALGAVVLLLLNGR